MYVRVLMRGAARYRGSEQGKGRRGSGGKKKKSCAQGLEMHEFF
jgi:hypothetical protein